LLRRGRAAVLVSVPTEPCTDYLNTEEMKDRCGRANEARIGEGRKSLLTTTITTATSTPAPALAPTMSHNGLEFAAELAVVGAESPAVVGPAVGVAVGIVVRVDGVRLGVEVGVRLGVQVEGLLVGVRLGVEVGVRLGVLVLRVGHVTPLRHKLAGPQVVGKGHSTTPVKVHAEGQQKRNDAIKKRWQKH
jgi:hypothetical protein